MDFFCCISPYRRRTFDFFYKDWMLIFQQHSENEFSEIGIQWRFRSSCAFDRQGWKFSSCGQRELWSACASADAQADQSLRWVHIFEGTSSHVVLIYRWKSMAWWSLCPSYVSLWLSRHLDQQLALWLHKHKYHAKHWTVWSFNRTNRMGWFEVTPAWIIRALWST